MHLCNVELLVCLCLHLFLGSISCALSKSCSKKKENKKAQSVKTCICTIIPDMSRIMSSQQQKIWALHACIAPKECALKRCWEPSSNAWLQKAGLCEVKAINQIREFICIRSYYLCILKRKCKNWSVRDFYAICNLAVFHVWSRLVKRTVTCTNVVNRWILYNVVRDIILHAPFRPKIR